MLSRDHSALVTSPLGRQPLQHHVPPDEQLRLNFVDAVCAALHRCLELQKEKLKAVVLLPKMKVLGLMVHLMAEDSSCDLEVKEVAKVVHPMVQYQLQDVKVESMVRLKADYLLLGVTVEWMVRSKVVVGSV